MKKALSIIMLLICLSPCVAQVTYEDLMRNYDTAAIFQYSTTRFKLNDKFLKKKQLRSLLMSYPESARAYALYKEQKRFSNTLIWTSLGGYVASFFFIDSDPEIALLVMGGSVVTALASIGPSVNATRHLQRSVWLYNRSRLTGEPKMGHGANLQP